MNPIELFSGRRRVTPQRDTVQYPRGRSVSGLTDKRPQIKPSPANLRQFAKTTFARRAIKRIKDPIAGLEWAIVPIKGVTESKQLMKQAETITRCLQRPNYDDSFRSFLEQLIEDACVCGAACYEQQISSDDNRPIWLWPVDALSIQIYPGWTGKEREARYCQALGYGNVGGVKGRDLSNEELVYIKHDPSSDTPFGLGPLEVAFRAINQKLGISDYAGNLASNAQPANLLYFEGADDQYIESLRDYWRNEIEGRGQTPLIGGPANSGGGGAQAISLRGTDDKALFIEYQEFMIREIMTSFCLSPMNGGIERDVNRATAEVTDDQDWTNAISPMATNICAYITRETLHKRLGAHLLQLKFAGLQRDDAELQSKVYRSEYESNAITPNEYRVRIGRPELTEPWADMLKIDADLALADRKTKLKPMQKEPE